MGMPTDGLSAFGAVPGIVELHSTPPPVGPAEDDDCKSSIPGCRCSATISGIACGLRAARTPAQTGGGVGYPAGTRVGMGMPTDGAGGRRRLQVVDPGMSVFRDDLRDRLRPRERLHKPGAGSGALRAPGSAWGCRPTVDDGMGCRPTRSVARASARQARRAATPCRHDRSGAARRPESPETSTPGALRAPCRHGDADRRGL
jgi:hypothetical protein